MENELEKKGIVSIFNDSSIKKGVVASLIATIIFIAILQPLMTLLWKFLNKTSIVVYSRYLDYIYKYAASGHKNDIDFYLITIVIIIFFMSLLSLVIIKSLQNKEIREKRLLLNILDPIKRSEEHKKILDKKFSKRGIFNFLDKYLLKLTMVYLLFTGIYFSSELFKYSSDLKLNTTFNQRLNAIAPYISETKEKELISKWALMRSKKDYLNIKLSIDTVAIRNNLILPQEFEK
jgi:hypothetical protein